MAQFASSLYPQTNPSNLVLLNLRECCDIKDIPSARVAKVFLKNWELLLVIRVSPPEQRAHARRVLTRLASLTG